MWKKIIIAVLAIGVAVTIYFLATGNGETTYITEKAEYKNVNQIVDVDGTVESNSKIDLQFQNSGQIEDIFFKIGDKIKKGDILAALENTLLKIESEKALAGLEMAQAELDLRYAGPSKEEKRIYEAKISEAEINLNNALLTFSDTKLANQENLKKAELAVKNSEIILETAENNFKNSQSSGETSQDIAKKTLENSYKNSKTEIINTIDSAKNSVLVADSILGIDDKSANDAFESRLGEGDFSINIKTTDAYSVTKVELKKLQDEYELIKTTWTDTQVENILKTAESTLKIIKDLLDLVYFMLEKTPTWSGFSFNEREALKTRVSAKQTEVTTHLQSIQTLLQTIENAKLSLTSTELNSNTGLNTAEGTFNEAKNQLEITKSNLEEIKVQNRISENSAQMQVDLTRVLLETAKANYAKLVAKPRQVDVAALQAQIRQVRATHEQTLKQLEDTQLISPVNGVLTDINADIGENVTTMQNIVVLMTDTLQIKANISETDINKIKVGNEVDVTFDSLAPDKIFAGKVVSINPAETLIQGVIYYETTVILDKEEKDIRSGMTANLIIKTGTKENVLAISPQSVQFEGAKTYVYILENGQKVEREISTGLEGEDSIEIILGLKEGDEVIMYEK